MYIIEATLFRIIHQSDEDALGLLNLADDTMSWSSDHFRVRFRLMLERSKVFRMRAERFLSPTFERRIHASAFAM
jgi:hypothetical protein